MESYTYGDKIPRAIGHPKIHWYVGIPGSGKTFLAYAHAREDARLNGYPILVINSAETADFGDLPRAGSVSDCIRTVWGKRSHTQYIPRDIEEVDSLVRAGLHPGKINLLIDETHFWVTARGTSTQSPLVKLCRAYRHGKTSVYFTTQHFSGDIPSEMVSCAPEFYVFRSTAPAVLERLERWHGIAPDGVKALPARRFFFLHEGFSLT